MCLTSVPTMLLTKFYERLSARRKLLFRRTAHRVPICLHRMRRRLLDPPMKDSSQPVKLNHSCRGSHLLSSTGPLVLRFSQRLLEAVVRAEERTCRWWPSLPSAHWQLLLFLPPYEEGLRTRARSTQPSSCTRQSRCKHNTTCGACSLRFAQNGQLQICTKHIS